MAGASQTTPPLGPMRLESDLRIAYLVLNDARYRTMTKLFGLPRDQVNLASLVLLGMIGHAAHNGVRRMAGGPPFPRADSLAFGVAGMRELVQGIAGPASRDTSMFGTLVALAALGGVSAPVVRRSVRAFEHGSERVGHAIRHRYGYYKPTVMSKVRGNVSITPGLRRPRTGRSTSPSRAG